MNAIYNGLSVGVQLSTDHVTIGDTLLTLRSIVFVSSCNTSVTIRTLTETTTPFQLTCLLFSPFKVKEHKFSFLETSVDTVKAWETHLRTKCYLRKPQQKWFTILNPNSGSKRSLQVFNDFVRPALAAAGIEVDVAMSEYPKHSTLLAKFSDRNPSEYDGLIVCGGDGSILELQNGNVAAFNLPVAVIPTGSDNCMATTLGMKTLYDATMVIIKGIILDVDGMEVKEYDEKNNEDGDRITFAFCCVGWGFVSAVLEDIEKHRWMGPVKTNFCGMKTLLAPAFEGYPANLSWRPRQGPKTRCKRPEGVECVDCLNKSVDGRDRDRPMMYHGATSFTAINIGCQPGKNTVCPHDGQMWPYGHLSDGCLDILIAAETNKSNFMTALSGIYVDGYSHCRVDGVTTEKASEVILQRLEGDRTKLLTFGIDGELFSPKTSAIIVKVCPGLGRFMVPSPMLKPLQDPRTLYSDRAKRGFVHCMRCLCGVDNGSSEVTVV